MADKVMCVISLDKDIKEKSHEVGLNISKITENSLRFILNRMEDYTAVISQDKKPVTTEVTA